MMPWARGVGQGSLQNGAGIWNTDINQMTHTFFDQSILKPRILPSKPQKQFLQNKLPFLDPQSGKQIHGKDVLAILSHANLPKDKIRHIWMIANQKNNEYLTYEDMYVAFRLISYAQNGIQLSKESVESNIKCPLPALVDSDDESETSSRVPPITNKRPPSVSQGYFGSQERLAFGEAWPNISSNQHYISGHEVRKKFQSHGEKTQLSKIWRLCCLTVKGSLTKGEFFVFRQIIKMHNDGVGVPDILTTEMFSAIASIDSDLKNNPNLLPKSILVDRVNSPNHLQRLQSKLKQRDEPIQQLHSQLSSIQSEQSKFSSLIQQFGSYVETCEKNTSLLAGEIERLKAAQAESVNRLNADLSKLKDVVERQNTMIYQLTATLKNKTGDPNIHLPQKRQLTSNFEHEAPSRFSVKSLESEGSRNDLYPYQLQTIKLLHAVSPISVEDLPEVQKKILAMGVNELKSFYQTLLLKYQQQSVIDHDKSQQDQNLDHSPINVSVTHEQGAQVSQQTYHVRDESMFAKKDKDALETIENFFGNVDLNDSGYRKPTEDFFA